jgi:VWFA-related protein
MLKSFHLLIAVLALMMGLITQSVGAQNTPQRVIINYTTVNESSDGQTLGLFFTVFDSQGQAILNPELENINIVLDNSAPVEVLGTSTPDLPFYITLVLDVSGSMGQASALMQSAAITAINNAPPNTQFAVIQFHHEITLLQSFTPDRNAVTQAIGQAQSVRGGGTCLYDAMYSGIEQLNTAPDPSRRAVIVFTDGRDEMNQGKGDTCSKHPSSEVIDFALSSPQPIPIYTIGLRGAVAMSRNCGILRMPQAAFQRLVIKPA